jgi:hypothetical protein
MAKKPVVVIGMGEMGSVFARGLLCLGHPVYPVGRSSNVKKLARALPAPGVVLVAVGEAELAGILETIPKPWRRRIALLQNELLPADYDQFDDVTVISVWFEKKKGQDSKVIIPSPAYGPRAKLLARALGTLGIPVRQLKRPRDLLFELVVKNLYILTSNIAGLRTGGSVSELWANHQPFAREVANEVIRLQEGLTGASFDRDGLIAATVEAFEGDPDHPCMGRSAPARLARALQHADQLGIELPTLSLVAAEQAQPGQT